MRKTLITLALLCVLQLCAFTAFENGKWSADIITPDNPNHAEDFAAKELQYHLGKALGKKPAIIKESQKSSLPYHFYIGGTKAAAACGVDKSKLAMDSRIIRSVKDGIVFVGGDRNGQSVGHQWSVACQGTLYAVYDYLENDLGVKWIWPGELGEVIPARTKLEVGKIDRSGIEPLVARRMRESGYSSNVKTITGWSSVDAWRKFMETQHLFLIRHRMGASVNLFHNHGFDSYWKTYGKIKPELFSLLTNGKREPLKGDPPGQYITMCVSNPELHKIIIQKWRSSIPRRKASPYTYMINLCENDSPGMCLCANCRAWDAPDPAFATSEYWGKKQDPLTRSGRFHRLSKVKWGEEGDKVVMQRQPSLSDRYAKFYMAVLKEAKKIDPNAKVIGYAYANYTQPPVETKLDKDVVLNMVPGTGFPYSQEDSNNIRGMITGWRKAGIKEFVFRPNYMLMGGNMPMNLGRIICGDFSFAAKNGMIGTNYDSLTGAWANHGMMLYALISLHRQPDLSYDQMMKDYCDIFAPADKEIAEYIKFWEEFSSSITDAEFLKLCSENKDRFGNLGGGHSSFYLVSAALYPRKLFVQANAILDKAEKRAKGNAVVLKRIAFLRKGLRDAELSRNCSAAYKAWQLAKAQNRPRPERVKLSTEFKKAFNAMAAFRASVEGDMVANYGHFATYEKYHASWPHKMIKVETKKK